MFSFELPYQFVFGKMISLKNLYWPIFYSFLPGWWYSPIFKSIAQLASSSRYYDCTWIHHGNSTRRWFKKFKRNRNAKTKFGWWFGHTRSWNIIWCQSIAIAGNFTGKKDYNFDIFLNVYFFRHNCKKVWIGFQKQF